MAQRKAAQFFLRILQEALQVWLVRENLQSRGILSFTQVGCQQPDGDQQEAQGQRPEKPQWKDSIIA